MARQQSRNKKTKNQTKVYDKRQNESTMWYERFKVYLSLPQAERTVQNAFNKVSEDSATYGTKEEFMEMKAWKFQADEHEWEDRAVVFDADKGESRFSIHDADLARRQRISLNNTFGQITAANAGFLAVLYRQIQPQVLEAMTDPEMPITKKVSMIERLGRLAIDLNNSYQTHSRIEFDEETPMKVAGLKVNDNNDQETGAGDEMKVVLPLTASEDEWVEAASNHKKVTH